MFENLNEDNFILYAMKYYDNSQCLSEVEFHNDLKIIKYIKRLLIHLPFMPKQSTSNKFLQGRQT